MIIIIFFVKSKSFRKSLIRRFLVFKLRVEFLKFLIFLKNLRLDKIRKIILKEIEFLKNLLKQDFSIKNKKWAINFSNNLSIFSWRNNNFIKIFWIQAQHPLHSQNSKVLLSWLKHPFHETKTSKSHPSHLGSHFTQY